MPDACPPGPEWPRRPAGGRDPLVGTTRSDRPSDRAGPAVREILASLWLWLPFIAMCYPDIREMAKQIELVLLFSAQPPSDRLRGGVLAIDAMNDPLQFEGRERPVDCPSRRLRRVSLAAKLASYTPADLKSRPARRKPGSHPSDEFSAGVFLDHKHADAVQHPMSRHDGRVAPSCQFGSDRFAVGGDETRRTRIGKHRRIRRDVCAAPRPQRQSVRLDHGTVGSGQPDTGLEGREHRASSSRSCKELLTV